MLNNQIFYHQTIRNTIVAFGNLFSNIYIARRKNGVVEQTIQVPIAYSAKEKWVHSIEANPDADGGMGVYTTLPKLAFEITGFNYDASRKLARMNTINCVDSDGSGREQIFTPVPWNMDLSLYFATKTEEDGFQILEQILPTFTPEYTLAVNCIPELNIKQDIPFILNSVSKSDDYEGDLSTRRFVIHTITFTAKLNIFGGLNNVGLIRRAEANVSTRNIENPERLYVATQTTPVAPINENWADSI